MKRFKKWTVLFISILLVLLSTQIPTMVGIKHTHLLSHSQKKGNEEWIIKWKGEVQEGITKEATILDWLPDLGVTRVKLNKDISTKEWLKEWTNSPNVKYIQPNYTYKIAETPNDTYYQNQNYLKQINAEAGWDIETTSDVTIAVLDTGVDMTHPDLAPNLVKGINLLDREKPPIDDNGHGTNVAGILAAVGNNNDGVAGLVWRTKIMPIKVLDENGKGESFFVAQGIRYAVDNGAQIVLLSLGESILEPFMKEAIAYAEKNNVLIIAASGNDGGQLNYPSALSNVLSVGAVDSMDHYASYSNYGQQLDVVAPGEGIYTTKPGGEYMSNSGTSMAAPQVAGLAALLLQKNPNLKPEEIANIIKFTADDVEGYGWDIKTGYGRINVGKALSALNYVLIDGYEPNDYSQNAHIFPLEDTFNAQLNQDDVDWYRLNLSYKGTVTLDIHIDQPLAYGITLEVYSEGNLPRDDIATSNEETDLDSFNNDYSHGTDVNWDNTIITSDSSIKVINKNKETITNDNQEPNIGTESENKPEPIATFNITDNQKISLELPKGNTYIKLYFTEKQLETNITLTNYTITNHFAIYKDSFEPNNSPWQAYVVNSLIPTFYGTFDTNNDEDWYKVNINQPGILSATVSVDTLRIDPVLLIQPMNSIALEFDYHESGKEEFGYLSVTPGIYYIKVSDYNNYSEDGEYKLQIKFKSSDGDGNEPNDLSVNASPLDLGQNIVRGSFLNENDNEWFTFTLDREAYLTMDFASDKETEFYLYNEDLEPIKTFNNITWNNSEVIDKGTYYIRLKSEFLENSYSLQVIKFELYGNFIDILNHWARDAIVKYTNENFIQGYEDYTFKPDQKITRGEVALFLDKALNLQSEKQVNFKDVDNKGELYSAINHVTNAGLLKGFKDNTFRSNQFITREELVLILTKVFDIPVIKGTTQQFRDVDEGNAAYNEINTYFAYDLITELLEENNFNPKNPVTRGEFVGLFDRTSTFVPPVETDTGLEINVENNKKVDEKEGKMIKEFYQDR